MSARVTTEVDAEGRVLACKRAHNADADDARRLRHEAEMLDLARHPGVVELVSCESDGDDVTLLTRFAGTHSLDTVGPVTVARAAGIVAALASTVADLHDLGIAHGRIDPSHVVIGAGGRPLLCGFGGGGRVGCRPGSTAIPGFIDSAASGEATLAPETDVYGLGAVLRALVVDGPNEFEPIPDRRFNLARLRPMWSGYQRRALLTLADRATDEMPLRRPPARRFASDILETVPSATIDDAMPFTAPGTTQRDQSRRLTLGPTIAAAIALLVVAAFVTNAWRGARSAASPAAPSMVATVAATSDQTATTDGPCGTAPRGPDLDGDGCGDAVEVQPDRVVAVGTTRFTVGAPGDQVALGDWDCDGTSTIALLRPSTGEVFVFDSWAISGTDVTVTPTANVRDGVAVEARAEGRCATLVVLHKDGTRQDVEQ